MKAFLVWGNLAFCGFIMMNITMFFVGGTIVENYDNETFVAPQFFWIVPIWLLWTTILIGLWY